MPPACSPPAARPSGVLYMDSRLAAADLAGGNRELLQTLAIEASTVLENARLLEEERAKQRMEEELKVARTIQQSLLPRKLPVRAAGCAPRAAAWLRASGRRLLRRDPPSTRCWCAVVADVSGKGVSSALLARCCRAR
jgi:phosphoserine phosphatase RsbU/P